MKSKIRLAFDRCKKEKRPALITYTVAGDNTKKNSLKILNKISKYADILELGFPHNTPIADGGQIQGSSFRALKNGIKLKDVFQIVKSFKKIGLFFWKSGDQNTIDRYGPDGISKLVKKLSDKAVKFQTGFIYDYAFVMLIGLSALITYLILK